MARVVVIGSSNTDLTVRLPRLPGPGQTVLGQSFATSPGGKGANQAVAARRAGAEVVLVAAVGDDHLGHSAIEGYRREGITVEHLRVVPGVASGVALIFVGEEGENMIGVAPGANLELSPEDVSRLPDNLFQPRDVLLTGLEIPIATALQAMRRGRYGGMQVILNPAPAPSLPTEEIGELLAAADVITPNRVEALMLAGAGVPGEASFDAAGCVARLRDLGARGVVITLGSRGCLVADGPRLETILAPQVEAVDTVGAGDAFNGALAVALAEGRSLVAAAAWATTAAALAVTRPGAQAALPTRSAIDALAALPEA